MNFRARIKIRAVQLLTAELQDSTQLIPGAEYPVWLPLDAYDAAETLSNILVEGRKGTQAQ